MGILILKKKKRLVYNRSLGYFHVLKLNGSYFHEVYENPQI